jgi:sigma-B regulation protein RsbU (phosphoserine phosphatase)
MVSPSSSSQPVNPQLAGRQGFGARANQFWRRVTDGLELNQLWNQFRADARASYSLYSREIDSTPKEGVRRGKRWVGVARQFFWAILEKLSPARRVLLLFALLMIVFNPELGWTTKEGTHVIGFDLRLWGGLLMFFLLILEVADRVVMKRDLQIAREIQMWLLPTNPPHVPGIDIAFATRPANTVAGDYYDVFARPAYASANQSYLVAVADVAGKSIPAALLMATFQASLKTLSATPSSLVELVNGMNQYACSNSQGGLRFVTAFLAEYEPATRTLTYINAGHNQPILRQHSGLIQRLDAGGLPFGIKADAGYLTGTVAFETGDWLVVFTDGVVEAINEPGTDYGEQRLISILNAGREASPVKILSRIMVDLDFFVGNTPQQDDITCLLIKAV